MITRILYSAVALATFLVMIPDTGTAATALPVTTAEMTQDTGASTTAEHAASEAGHASGPHIPAPKGDIIEGWEIAGIPITNTVFSTWIFMALMVILIGVFSVALRTDKFPRLKAFGLDIVARILAYTT
jgi:hypothetical protein